MQRNICTFPIIQQLRGYGENKTKAKYVTQPRSVKVDERVPVPSPKNTASLLCAWAAVGMSEPGVILGIFMLCCTPNRQNCSQSEQAEKFRTNTRITQCV